MLNGNISIFRHGTLDSDCVRLVIKDELSSELVLECDIKTDEFTRVLTGFSERPMQYNINYGAIRLIGKKKIVKKVSFDTDLCCTNRRELTNAVLKDYCENYKSDGWIIQNNGLNMQQDLYKKHQYYICKYENVEENN